MARQENTVSTDTLDAFLRSFDEELTQEEQERKQATDPLKHKRHRQNGETTSPMRQELLRLHKRYRQFRRALQSAVLLLILLWLPWILEQFGVLLPFYGDSVANRGICQGIVQFVLLLVSLPIWQEALHQHNRGCMASLVTNVVTLLDAVLPIPGQQDTEPLCGVAAFALVLTLWGNREQYRGWYESLHLLSIGTPLYGLGAGEDRVAKGQCETADFYPHLVGEDTPAQWQRLLLPLTLVAAVALSLLCSVGQGQPEKVLWCLATILCAATPLVAVFAYPLPFGRLAVRLAQFGVAVAGQWGTNALVRAGRLVVADEDLFPNLQITNVRLFGEERNQALSYATSMARQGGGCLARAFDRYCRSEGVSPQTVEYFHVHDEGGFSGILHGETVLLGNTGFLRRMGIRLPETAENRTLVGLAVDGELTALYLLEYAVHPRLRQLVQGLGGKRLLMAVVDGNITPRRMKQLFGIEGESYPEMSRRRELLREEQEVKNPCGVLYREGFPPIAELLLGCLRLQRMVRLGSLLLVLSQVCGLLLASYLLSTASYGVLSPTMLLCYQFLWVLPLLPLLWGINRV